MSWSSSPARRPASPARPTHCASTAWATPRTRSPPPTTEFLCSGSSQNAADVTLASSRTSAAFWSSPPRRQLVVRLGHRELSPPLARVIHIARYTARTCLTLTHARSIGGASGLSRTLAPHSRRSGGTADTEHSKCFARKGVRVQIPPPAPDLLTRRAIDGRNGR